MCSYGYRPVCSPSAVATSVDAHACCGPVLVNNDVRPLLLVVDPHKRHNFGGMLLFYASPRCVYMYPALSLLRHITYV